MGRDNKRGAGRGRLSRLRARLTGKAIHRARPGVLTPGQGKLVKLWAGSAWEYLKGKDEDGTPLVWTKDEGDDGDNYGRGAGIKPFPDYLDYLREYVTLLVRERLVFVDKSRQMVISTATLLVIDWFCSFSTARRCLVSKTKEQDAIEIIRDKIRFPHSQMPQWYQEWNPVTPRPARIIHYKRTGSKTIGVPQNVAFSESRGGTATIVMIDEAAFQAMLGDILQAAIPMASRIWAVTTANIGNPGARECLEILREVEKVEPDPSPNLHGFKIRRAPTGMAVVSLDYFADPRKDEGWAHTMRVKLRSEQRWKREFMRDWTSAAGLPFYPEYAASPETFELPFNQTLPDLPVDRGWDFGYRMPACVWTIYSPKSERLIVLRSIMPQNMDTYSFRELVKYLSGQGDRNALKKYPKAMSWVKRLEDEGQVTPWFEGYVHFRDWAGHEATEITNRSATEHKEKTDAEILQAGGITLGVYYTRVSAREAVIRKLLQTLPDGLPALLIDPRFNRELCQGMRGGISYPKPTAARPDPTEPLKDGFFDHLHDALGYGIVNVVPAPDPMWTPPRVEFRDRTPVSVNEEDGWDLSETREK